MRLKRGVIRIRSVHVRDFIEVFGAFGTEVGRRRKVLNMPNKTKKVMPRCREVLVGLPGRCGL